MDVPDGYTQVRAVAQRSQSARVETLTARLLVLDCMNTNPGAEMVYTIPLKSTGTTWKPGVDKRGTRTIDFQQYIAVQTMPHSHMTLP